MFLSHSGVHDLKKELGAENSFDGIEQYRSKTAGSIGTWGSATYYFILLMHVRFKIRFTFTYFGCVGTNCLAASSLSLIFFLLGSLRAGITGLGVIDSSKAR